eukprot:5156436-Prymnesium_polylepis.1
MPVLPWYGLGTGQGYVAKHEMLRTRHDNAAAGDGRPCYQLESSAQSDRHAATAQLGPAPSATHP